MHPPAPPNPPSSAPPSPIAPAALRTQPSSLRSLRFLRLREAQPDDTPAIAQIRNAAWQAAYPAFLPAEFLRTLDAAAMAQGLRLALLASPPPFRLQLAETINHDASTCDISGFSIVGAPRVNAQPMHPDETELWALNVHPSAWRSGCATALVRAAQQIARERDTRSRPHDSASLLLWCLDGNAPAEALYRRCGFSQTGVRRTTTGLTGHPLAESQWRWHDSRAG